MSQASSDFGDFGGAIEYDGTQPADDMPQIAPAPVYRKKGINIYTLMLILSLIFLTAGAILLFTNLGGYQL
jgi:hypothetical protein